MTEDRGDMTEEREVTADSRGAKAEDSERFRALPEPAAPEDWVETVDVRVVHPPLTELEERERMLREAGGDGLP